MRKKSKTLRHIRVQRMIEKRYSGKTMVIYVPRYRTNVTLLISEATVQIINLFNYHKTHGLLIKGCIICNDDLYATMTNRTNLISYIHSRITHEVYTFFNQDLDVKSELSMEDTTVFLSIPSSIHHC